MVFWMIVLVECCGFVGLVVDGDFEFVCVVCIDDVVIVWLCCC